MKKSNVEIAKMVAVKGYDFNEALEGIDMFRSPEDEGKEITQEELDGIIESVCFSFIENEEMDMNK